MLSMIKRMLQYFSKQSRANRHPSYIEAYNNGLHSRVFNTEGKMSTLIAQLEGNVPFCEPYRTKALSATRGWKVARLERFG